MRTMTERGSGTPGGVDGSLIGIVSIGDMVKARNPASSKRNAHTCTPYHRRPGS